MIFVNHHIVIALSVGLLDGQPAPKTLQYLHGAIPFYFQCQCAKVGYQESSETRNPVGSSRGHFIVSDPLPTPIMKGHRVVGQLAVDNRPDLVYDIRRDHENAS